MKFNLSPAIFAAAALLPGAAMAEDPGFTAEYTSLEFTGGPPAVTFSDNVAWNKNFMLTNDRSISRANTDFLFDSEWDSEDPSGDHVLSYQSDGSCDLETKDLPYVTVDLGATMWVDVLRVHFLHAGQASYCNVFMSTWMDGEDPPIEPLERPLTRFPSASPVTGSPTSTPSLSPTVQATPEPTPPPTPEPTDPISCHLCRGPKFICERSHVSSKCLTSDQQYCINDVENLKDGSRYVTRRCANHAECVKDWIVESADRNECKNYNVVILQDAHFECSFCCAGDDCNLETVPDNLYSERRRELSENRYSSGSSHAMGEEVPAAGMDMPIHSEVRYIKLWVGANNVGATSGIKGLEILEQIEGNLEMEVDVDLNPTDSHQFVEGGDVEVEFQNFQEEEDELPDMGTTSPGVTGKGGSGGSGGPGASGKGASGGTGVAGAGAGATNAAKGIKGLAGKSAATGDTGTGATGAPKGVKGVTGKSAATAATVTGTGKSTTTAATGKQASGSATGDPHFKLWTGQKFDFHGACDLCLLKNDKFRDGRGLHIHIRTQIETWWSFIQSVVVKLGEDTIEVSSLTDGGAYWINGVQGPTMNNADNFYVGGFQGVFKSVSDKHKKFRLDLGNGNAIAVDIFKSFVGVTVGARDDRDFAGSLGLMGSYPNGAMLARDGRTILEDPIAFGQEWQVLESEPMMFHTLGEGPHHPQQCTMPDMEASAVRKKRRLGESVISKEKAAIVCKKVESRNGDFDSCIFDVLATNDIEMADFY